MLDELKYFIRESGAVNGISMMSKLFADSLAFKLPWLNFLEWIPKMRTFPLLKETVFEWMQMLLNLLNNNKIS